MGEKNGVAVLGMANGKQIEQIPLARIQASIIWSAEVADIVPLSVRAIDFLLYRWRVYIGFRYTGSDHPHYNGIFELDDIFITAD